jgi:hypothetical protein
MVDWVHRSPNFLRDLEPVLSLLLLEMPLGFGQPFSDGPSNPLSANGQDEQGNRYQGFDEPRNTETT